MILNCKNPSEGFILFPMLCILMVAALLLFSLGQHCYTHILLTQEIQQYLNTTRNFNTLIPDIETELSLRTKITLQPENQQTLIDHVNTWPNLDAQTQSYSQLIHQNGNTLIYSSLILLKDTHQQARTLYELISVCTLADHRCNPLQSTLL